MTGYYHRLVLESMEDGVPVYRFECYADEEGCSSLSCHQAECAMCEGDGLLARWEWGHNYRAAPCPGCKGKGYTTVDRCDYAGWLADPDHLSEAIAGRFEGPPPWAVEPKWTKDGLEVTPVVVQDWFA